MEDLILGEMGQRRKRMSELIIGGCRSEVGIVGGGINDVSDGMEVDKERDEDPTNFVPDDDDDYDYDYVYVDKEEEEEEEVEESEGGSSESDCQAVFKRAKITKINEIDMRKYRKQVEESQGFDVDAVPGRTQFHCFILPVPIKGFRKFYSGLVRFAIHRHNCWTQGRGIELITLLKVNSHAKPWHTWYFTFEGKDLADDKIKTYQTCLVIVPGVGHVLKLFRLKPPANLSGCQNLVLDECEASKMPSDSDLSWTCKQTEFLDKARKAGISHFVRRFCKSWQQKDGGQDQSSYDDDLYPPFPKGPKKFSRINLERYYREVEENEGYDVSLLPRMGQYGLITPIPRPWSKSFQNRVQRCARLAIDDFNQKEGAQLKFLKIVKVNCTDTSTPFLYITFVAEDGVGVDGEAKTYQARLLITLGKEEVIEVRAKPNRKDKSGRRS